MPGPNAIASIVGTAFAAPLHPAIMPQAGPSNHIVFQGWVLKKRRKKMQGLSLLCRAYNHAELYLLSQVSPAGISHSIIPVSSRIPLSLVSPRATKSYCRRLPSPQHPDARISISIRLTRRST